MEEPHIISVHDYLENLSVPVYFTILDKMKSKVLVKAFSSTYGGKV